ncbi:MAG: zinc metallopeptidase [Akkermansia sp.]|nr:zinc metallopeptidase [Akkermansia sp.]
MESQILYIQQLPDILAYYGDGLKGHIGAYSFLTLVGVALIIITGIIGAIIQNRLKAAMTRYSAVYVPMTGAQVAQQMLHDHGIYDVRVTHTPGRLTDHYNPADKTVNLSDTVYSQPSIAAMAVAAHECGHAIQHAQAYPWLGLRSQLVPMVNIGAKIGQFVLIAGLILLSLGNGATVAWVGLALFGSTALFALVTLPVELNASQRALQWLEHSGYARGELHSNASSALRWAAMTYVAAALSALAMVLYYAFIILSRSRGDRR